MSYEALAWGRYVNTYERSWEIVRRADHPALGLCVDSFHILSRGSDPAGIRDIPGEKLFFLQLADAPHMDMDVLQWSRHHRLFPGQGAWDLPAFLGHVLTAGYTGPLSLEVFNDVFRQSDPRRSAVDALRSLLALQEATLPAAGRADPGAGGGDRAAADPAAGRVRLHRAGRRRRRHGGAVRWPRSASRTPGSTAPSRCSCGSRARARVLLNAVGRRPGGAAVGRAAVAARRGPRPAAAGTGRGAAGPGAAPHPRAGGGRPLRGGRAGRNRGVLLPHRRRRAGAGWLADFEPTGPDAAAGAGTGITGVDHVALTQPFDRFDEAALFYRSVLGLQPQHSSEVAAPFGLVRNRAVADPDADHPALPVASRCCAAARSGSRGCPTRSTWPSPPTTSWPPPGPPGRPAPRWSRCRTTTTTTWTPGWPRTRSCWPRCASWACCWTGTRDGEFLHFYTEVLGGRVFFEVVQRIGGYAGYGEVNAPIRMAAHRRQRHPRRRRGGEPSAAVRRRAGVAGSRRSGAPDTSRRRAAGRADRSARHRPGPPTRYPPTSCCRRGSAGPVRAFVRDAVDAGGPRLMLLFMPAFALALITSSDRSRSSGDTLLLVSLAVLAWWPWTPLVLGWSIMRAARQAFPSEQVGGLGTLWYVFMRAHRPRSMRRPPPIVSRSVRSRRPRRRCRCRGPGATLEVPGFDRVRPASGRHPAATRAARGRPPASRGRAQEGPPCPPPSGNGSATGCCTPASSWAPTASR